MQIAHTHVSCTRYKYSRDKAPMVLPLITASHATALWHIDCAATTLPRFVIRRQASSRETLTNLPSQILLHFGLDATDVQMSETPHFVPPPSTSLVTGRASSELCWLEPGKDYVQHRRTRVLYSLEVWESHKEEIRRLYIDEHGTLGHVMEIMSQKGFRPT
jgi:hypothetical protein